MEEDVGSSPARALRIPPYWLPDEAVVLTDDSSNELSAEALEVGFLVVVEEVADESSSVVVLDLTVEEAKLVPVSVEEADEVRNEAVVLESEPSSPPRSAERRPPPVDEEGASEDELVRDRAVVVMVVELVSLSVVDEVVANVG